MRTTTARLVALGLIVAACSGNTADVSSTTTSSEPTTTLTSTTTTTLPPTTTTSTVVDYDTSLINGTAVTDPELMNRRVLAVKIDNHPTANPQTGISAAEMIVEVRVEGITRFISIWHESDTATLGPMRSGRPTDGSLLAGLAEPTFAVSGAQAWVQGLIVGKDVHLVGETGPPATFRDSSRNAPHNLYVDTAELREVANRRGFPDEAPPGPIWEFGPMSDHADTATTVTIEFGASNVVWTWNPFFNVWRRTAYGETGTSIDETGTERGIAVPVLVALYTESYTASPPAGVPGKALPASQVVGSGIAYVFADGRVSEGTWERATEEEWFTLKDPNDEILLVPPGKVWVSLVPAHLGLTIDE